MGWAGEYRDEETKLVYLRARYYDPKTAQFLTRDPIEHATLDAYGYAANNPVNYTDPTGLNKCEAGANPLRWAGNAIDCASEAVDDLAGTDVCIDVSNPGCQSIDEQAPWISDALEHVVLGSAAMACTAGTLGVCGAAVGLSVTGTSIHDASRADSAKGAWQAVLGNAAFGWAGYVFGVPAWFGNTSKLARGLLGAGGALFSWLPDLLEDVC